MRRRGVQQAYNAEHGIDPQTIREAVTDILSLIRPNESAPMPGKDRRSRMRDDKRKPSGAVALHDLPSDELERLIRTLEEEMHEASADLRFEYAARIRDEINDLKRELKDIRA